MNEERWFQPNGGRAWDKAVRVASIWLVVGSVLVSAAVAQGQEALRDAKLEWNSTRRLLYVSLSYRDVVDEKVKRKLSRGLPTALVFTATVFRVGQKTPVSTTAQSCRVTWHVWEEAYRVEIDRPGEHETRWTTTVEGVLRRCAEAKRLLLADSRQVPPRTAVFLRAVVQVNPVGKDILQKIKRWVSRPSGTGTAAPGDALFGTFTGLFLQRISESERELRFSTKPEVPSVQQKEKSKR